MARQERTAEHIKQLEEMLRDCERLAQIGRLAASLAHEIKNPLESLASVLYLMEKDADDEKLRHIAIGKKELARAVEIADQTLDFARRDAPNPVPVKISLILDDVVDFYQRKAAYKKVSIEVRQSFDGEIKGSPGEFRQIFSNLVVNSLEVVERGRGQLKLHSFGCRNWSYWEQLGVRVAVADNGPGIPREHYKQIFEPFFTTKRKGTGLGLWITHSLVQKYGGTIRLRSSMRPGQSGTCFSVFLPC